MKKKLLASIAIRYSILIILGLLMPFFYKILFPLTIYPVYFILNFFYDVSISGSTLFFSFAEIEIISACIAGSAYYLLLILNLTTSMKRFQRIYSILFSVFLLLAFNILRIILLSTFLVEGFYFAFFHKLFWYLLSIIAVVLIWLLTVRIFRIKNIPVYSDFKKLNSRIRALN